MFELNPDRLDFDVLDHNIKVMSGELKLNHQIGGNELLVVSFFLRDFKNTNFKDFRAINEQNTR